MRDFTVSKKKSLNSAGMIFFVFIFSILFLIFNFGVPTQTCQPSV